MTLAEYRQTGGVKGSIEAAVERAMAAANSDPGVPRDRAARLALLRRALIPWLAGIDPETGAPRRRIARMAEIPEEARPLVEHLVAARLLATDVGENGEATIEPAHEALLRQWGLLQGWLEQDFGAAGGVGRAQARHARLGGERQGRELAQPCRRSAGGRRAARGARRSRPPDRRAGTRVSRGVPGQGNSGEKPDAPRASAHLRAAARRHRRSCRLDQSGVHQGAGELVVTMRPYMLSQVRPYVLGAEAVRALKPGASFRECAKDCPEMIVLPAGHFTMGSLATETVADDHKGPVHDVTESPQHEVTIPKPFAVAKFDVTFADWDACVSVGGCPAVSDGGMGRGRRPVINVTWDDARTYAAWLSRMTGKPYRLLSEAEWEYAARAGSRRPTSGATRSQRETPIATAVAANGTTKRLRLSAPSLPTHSDFTIWLGTFGSGSGLLSPDYEGAPVDGSAWIETACNAASCAAVPGTDRPQYLRSASRVT